MAMLADKRERANYVLQPRGKALYEDGNRFGTRMLEKMGWSAGKGLGANEDGQKEFVRIKYKNSTSGFGFQDRNDQWTQHEEQFDGLLKTLGGSGQNPTEDAVSSLATGGKFSGESLEEKSKKSRARVHYKKFTKGKDLSQYSEKDLANIFGRKTLEKEAPLAFGIHSVDESSNSAPESGEGKKFGITTISTGTSINEYFKRKMESIKTKAYGAQEANCEEISVKFEDDGKNVKKKKKKQKSKELDEDCTVLSESILNAEQENGGQNEGFVEECVAIEDEIERSRKIKKSKRRKSETRETSDSQNLGLTESKKKKKQKEKENGRPDDCNGSHGGAENAKLENDIENACYTEERMFSSDSDDSNTKRHKRKRCKSETRESCDPGDLELYDSKKKKKDKRVHYEDESASGINGDSSADVLQKATLAISTDMDLLQSTKKEKQAGVGGGSSSETELNKVVNEDISCGQNKSKKKKKTKTNNGEKVKESAETHPENGIDKKIECNGENEEISKNDSNRNSNIQENEHIINSFVALRFRNADLNGFPGSNIAAINGYRTPKNLKLIVIEKPQDMINVTKFCCDAIEKAKPKEAKPKNKKKKKSENVNKTSQAEGKVEKTEKKRRQKFTYTQLIQKVKNRDVLSII